MIKLQSENYSEDSNKYILCITSTLFSTLMMLWMFSFASKKLKKKKKLFLNILLQHIMINFI